MNQNAQKVDILSKVCLYCSLCHCLGHSISVPLPTPKCVYVCICVCVYESDMAFQGAHLALNLKGWKACTLGNLLQNYLKSQI